MVEKPWFPISFLHDFKPEMCSPINRSKSWHLLIVTVFRPSPRSQTYSAPGCPTCVKDVRRQFPAWRSHCWAFRLHQEPWELVEHTTEIINGIGLGLGLWCSIYILYHEWDWDYIYIHTDIHVVYNMYIYIYTSIYNTYRKGKSQMWFTSIWLQG